ncbi:MAG: transposase [Planctomycetota bacterium]|jgi:REP element-mobilizing transposase RayT
MGRSHTCRRDGIGRWQHLYHRGAARRTVFETRRDNRYFLAQLAKAVHRGEVEIHAICLLTNHFHALVRSPDGRISQAMMRALQSYVRYFNRVADGLGTDLEPDMPSRPADWGR